MIESLKNYLLNFYSIAEFATLIDQMERWQKEQPFAGMRLIDATPVYRNTLSKYLPLLAGGANLTVSCGYNLPCAENARELLNNFQIKIATESTMQEEFDIVMDCAGVLRNIKSKYGYVELTHSGKQYYENSNQPVFLADAGRVKTIETALGTGDGFHRGLKQLGFTDIKGKKLVLFGCGKVGRGIAMYAYWQGAQIVVVDNPHKISLPADIEVVDMSDANAIDSTLKDAWCMVSATGIKGALVDKFSAQALVDSDTLIANMGVEDEFGPAIPTTRVLNNKEPLNFILDEPTHLKFIEPSMALVNYGAYKLIHNPPQAKGIILPSFEEEQEILDIIYKHGAISAELKRMEGFK